ncbi:MAG: hypothetical protein PVF83_12255 [Anaerolineales bacterium]|jgi:Cdc6-like AAA superfamily ATPase
MEDLKKIITNRLLSSLSTSPSSLVLNYGSWGGGKTHAARYFSQEKILNELSTKLDIVAPLSIVINIPRGSKNVIKDIYVNIIDYIGLTQIAKSLNSIYLKLDDNFRNVVSSFIKGEEFISAIELLAGIHKEGTQLLLDINPSEGISLELKRYFLASSSAKDLSVLGISRPLSSGSDMISMLSAIFNLLMYSKEIEPCYSEIIIWFDEMEEIISLPGKEQTSLTSLIRDLTDFVSINLTIFINFTLRPGGKINEVTAYITNAVISRIRQRIDFDGQFKEDDIVMYIKDLLNAPNFRNEAFKKEIPDENYPFDEETLKSISRKILPDAVPRKINETCSLILERALLSDITKNQGRIDLSFIEKIEPEIDEIILGLL